MLLRIPFFTAFVVFVVHLMLPLTPAHAQNLDGCKSEPILQRFEEFGRSGRMQLDLRFWLNDAKSQKVEPYQAFDNVYYVGVCWVSAWLIKTADGFVLIDTLHDPFTDLLIENIRKVGVDPKDSKLVLMTHGHFDHVGGAYKVKALAPNAQFVMTKTGWEEGVASAKQSESTPRRWIMISQDKVAKDGDIIKHGGMDFQLLETPGHTYGTASYVFKVTDQGKSYRAIVVGGLGLNAIEGSGQVDAYIASIDRLQTMMASTSTAIDVHLTTHPFSNGLTEAAERLKDRKPSEPHPLIDSKGFADQIKSLRAGAVDRLAVEKKAGR